MFIPTTQTEIPFNYYETGKLKKGMGTKELEGCDPLADYYINQEEGIIEVRIPWLLLNFRDPSKKEIIGDLWDVGLKASEYIESIEVSAGMGKNGKLLETIPKRENDSIEQEMLSYQWEVWETPSYKERLKASYYIFQEYFLKDEKDSE
jgi:hypothetical protein